ncbi:hypothetical protein LA080_006724 [Diaporthe eres]|nr:hypothetical protein LA080_006724 [Diaporthe eres]
MVPPVRVGLIGLSKSAAVSWASVAHLPYLLSPHGKAKYEITALCNSSVESAKRALEAFKLSPATKTYGDPAQLADDPDVDLVVCNVRVDRHHEIIRPSVAAGKAVFCEWPLASNLDQVRYLVNLAREKGGRTMIGTQGRVSPVVVKIRELLEQGRIGKVLSAEVRAAGGSNDRLALSEFMDYFAQRSVGGNFVTIGVGHLLDAVQFAIETVKADVPDLVIGTGTLRASPIAHEGATLYFRLRRGQPFLCEDPLVWTINGEKGEIRLSSPGGTALQATAYSKPVTIEVHVHETDNVQKIEWDWTEWQKGISVMGRNTGALYENYANGGAYPTFEDALKLHEKLEEIMGDWKAPVEMAMRADTAQFRASIADLELLK